jgi:anti-sigma-K factor RskA
MNCPMETREKTQALLDYCAGRLDSRAAALLEQHIESCSDCRALRDGQQTVWKALEAWEAPPVTANFDRRLYERIETRANVSWWNTLWQPVRPGVLRPAFAVAAVCVVMVAGFLLEGPNGSAPSTPQVPAETVEAEQVERTLEDLEMLREFDLLARPRIRQVKSM